MVTLLADAHLPPFTPIILAGLPRRLSVNDDGDGGGGDGGGGDGQSAAYGSVAA